MRSYPNDSAEAAARVVCMALLADGSLDRAEMEWLERSGAIEKMGLTTAAFDRVIEDFCNDLAQSSDHWSVGRQSLPAELVDTLLSEIQQPSRRVQLLGVVLQIIAADGRVTSTEAALLSRVTRQWAEGLEH